MMKIIKKMSAINGRKTTGTTERSVARIEIVLKSYSSDNLPAIEPRIAPIPDSAEIKPITE